MINARRAAGGVGYLLGDALEQELRGPLHVVKGGGERGAALVLGEPHLLELRHAPRRRLRGGGEGRRHLRLGFLVVRDEVIHILRFVVRKVLVVFPVLLAAQVLAVAVVVHAVRDFGLRRCDCPGQKPPFLAVKRSARPYKSTIENRFTVGKAKAAS
jgi:hypothetical protein